MLETLSLRRFARLSGRGELPPVISGFQSSVPFGSGVASLSSCTASSWSRVSGRELTPVDGLDELDQLGVGRAVIEQESGRAVHLVHRGEVALIRRDGLRAR